MTKTKMKKNQKPIEADVHFKYRCANENCSCYHWLSLKECKAKNFIVVCECGSIFKPKQIKTIKIVYEKIKSASKASSQTVIDKEISSVPVDTTEKCVKLLCSYGFTSEEANSMLLVAYQRNPTTEANLLVKYVLQNLGELDVSN